MTANSMEELRALMLKEADKAMRVASEKVLADMYEETGKFYTGKKPKVYKRTGALGDTPRTTANTKVRKSRDLAEVSFDAYLDTEHVYSSGDKPDMEKVLELANYGKPWQTKSGADAKDTVGRKGFWERAEKKMEKHFNQTMRKFGNGVIKEGG